MKRLVVCCDGTWSTAGQPSPTNVERLAKEIAPRAPDGTEQVVHYHDGVGTLPGERLLGGAFGYGLSAVVRDVYRTVVTAFRPGDQIFAIGFSRGAYTARSVVGLIRNCGVLRPEHVDRLEEAYALYRRRDDASAPDAAEAEQFRAAYSSETRIRFVGVWDTVGSLGIPLSGIELVDVLNRPWQFHDTRLSSTVDAACHAVAVDERRRPFRPTLWDPPTDGAVPRHQTWFAGCHGDVGGGEDSHGLSDVTLRWMARHAVDAGLALRPDSPLAPTRAGGPSPRIGDVAPDPLGPVHETMTWAYRLLGAFVRGIGTTDPTAEAAADTVVTRSTKAGLGYHPENLATYLAGPDHRVEDVDAPLGP
ncbi:DUF2235 domain-containing protein [Actinomycetospora sp. TBRC 11914]|uniref:DUF2235 domain-containing protein n=1 Tax=Actinomycetospora sp. TBRC 11914 TaxID=2729387 RepID=UPI00145F4DCE|nr:DUF2235 domain-containing protein [Actinomycetospora sp. TBRC 11914]NMO91173.1 DUF2235 domain-containing protein [Actinomycetospora sp. TBRC 11914]